MNLIFIKNKEPKTTKDVIIESLKSLNEDIMEMDKDTVDEILSNGHDWASDHIATSKDDVEEVYNFLKNKI